MEILQTIWNALTTENEMGVKIITIPLAIIEAALTVLLFTAILNIKSSKHKNLLYIITFSFIGIISMLFIKAPYNTFINIIACPILVYFIFKTNILKAILAEVIPYIVFFIFSSLLVMIFVKITNMSSNYFLLIPIYKLCYSILLYILIYTFYLLFTKFKLYINIVDKMKKGNNFIIFINFFIGIISLATHSYIFTLYMNKLPIFIVILNISVLLIYFLVSIYSLLRTSKLEVTTEKLEEEQLYNKTLTILYDNIRDFKHDFNNIVQSIGGYISTSNMDGLKDYYSGLMEDCKKVNNLAILNPELINNPAVYSLLTSKYHKSEELGIKMNFEVFLDLTTLNIKSYELSRILGILLDNAIEAASKCEEKEINIIIRKDNKANRQLFIIENTYSNKDVNMEKIFEKGFTSKTDEDIQSHGIGLWEVRKILKKNNNLNLFTTKDSRLFKQQLEIYI